jgi:hypothetical protein
MSQQFRRQFVALRDTLAASLRGVPPESRPRRATQLLHRLMFLTLLRRGGRLDGATDSFPALLRRLPFAGPFPEVPGHALSEVVAALQRYELSPDVLADTFEQSVNRRQTGSYYTGRDVADYIVRATILPRLLDDMAAACPEYLGPDGSGWRLLRDHPGPVRTPDDLVTRNLDAERFLLTVLAQDDSGQLPRALHEALRRLTVLDPTCGCGDFLLAALDLLAPLYAGCLTRPRGRADAEAVIASILRYNLRGADLSPEAVEVCGLRLWLRWAAAGSGQLDLQRLPDLSAALRVGDAIAGLDWPSAFPRAMRGGGFAVVVGNPPYVETAPADARHAGYRTARCGNLYALVVERALGLLAPDGRLGMIVPHSAFCTDRMAPLLRLVTDRAVTWVSTYDIRPCKLFAGVDQRLAIFLRHASPEPRIYSTRYHRWQESERPRLFAELRYLDVGGLSYQNSIPKAGDPIEARVWHKISARAPLGDDLGGQAVVYYHNAPRYWVRAMTFAPYFWNERDGAKLSAQVRTLAVRDAADAGAVAALLNSSLFCWWWLLLSDCRHLNRREIDRFPAGLAEMSRRRKRALGALCRRLMADYRRHAVRKVCRYRTTGKVVYDEFYPGRSKAILDEIDRALAGHYGLPDDEVGFLIRYDLKYRRPED